MSLTWEGLIKDCGSPEYITAYMFDDFRLSGLSPKEFNMYSERIYRYLQTLPQTTLTDISIAGLKAYDFIAPRGSVTHSSDSELHEYIQAHLAKIEEHRQQRREVTARVLRWIEWKKKQNAKKKEAEERQGGMLAEEVIPAQVNNGEGGSKIVG